MAQHVDDDAAAVLLAVVPRRALRRLPVALEHPVAELAAHRQDAPEEAAVDQRLELEQARQPELVLHHAVLHAGLLRSAIQIERLGRGRWRPASRSTRACRRRWRAGAGPVAAAWWRHRRTPRRARPPARASRSVVQRPRHGRGPGASSLAALRPTRMGSGMTRVPSASRTPPCLRISRIERTRCWLVPMRPVTPFMMMPMRRSLTACFSLPGCGPDDARAPVRWPRTLAQRDTPSRRPFWPGSSRERPRRSQCVHAPP